MRLSPHFAVEEFLVSKEHPELMTGVWPSAEEMQRLYLLAIFGLEPIREAFGRVTILSGLRTKSLNDALKASKTSQHLLGEAGDFTVENLEGAWGFVRHQLCWPGQAFLYPKKKFIHIALPRLGVAVLHQIKEG